MKLLRLSALAALLLGVSACTHMESRPAPVAPAGQAPAPPAPEAAQPAAATPQTSPPAGKGSQQPATPAPGQAAGGGPKRQPARPTSPPTTKTKPVTPPNSGTSTPPGAPPPAAAAPAAPTARADTTPTLDLAALEQRLRDTSAIGLFTKLSLKNQVDDLLKQFRGFHTKQSATPLSDLRQHYDSLLNKVLSLLQSGDPGLAQAISTSREAIWGILTDPRKFAAI